MGDVNLKYRTVVDMIKELENKIEQGDQYIVQNERVFMEEINSILKLLNELEKSGYEADLVKSHLAMVYDMKGEIFMAKAVVGSKPGRAPALLGSLFEEIPIIGPILEAIAIIIIGSTTRNVSVAAYVNKALKEFNKSLSYKETQIAHYHKGLCYAELNKKAKAKEELHICINMDSKSVAAVEAYKTISRLDTSKSGCSLVHVGIAVIAIICLFICSMSKGTKVNYTNTTNTSGNTTQNNSTPNKSDYNSYYDEGVTYYKQGKYDIAVKKFDKALELNPNHASTWNEKGYCYYYLGKSDIAIKCFERAISINPNFDDAWNGKGICYKRLGKNDIAIKCFETALSINPNNEYAKNNLKNNQNNENSDRKNDIELKLNQLEDAHEKAVEQFRQGSHDSWFQIKDILDEIDSSTGNKWVLQFTSKSNYENSKYNKYMNYGKFILILNDYGFLMEQTGYSKEAEPILRQVLKLSPDRTPAHLNLADTLYKINKKQEASKYYKSYIELMKKNKLEAKIPSRVYERI